MSDRWRELYAAECEKTARLEQDIAAAEARGFARAREMAAREGRFAVESWWDGANDMSRQLGEYVAQRIRAMQDVNGPGRPSEVARTGEGRVGSSDEFTRS